MSAHTEQENIALKTNINFMLGELEQLTSNGSLPAWVKKEINAIVTAVEAAMDYKKRYTAKSLTTGETGEHYLTREQFKHVHRTHPAWTNWMES